MGKMLTRFREGWAWTDKEEGLYRRLLDGFSPVVHLFSGRSMLGDVRIDKERFPEVTHRCMIHPKKDFKLPFRDKEFDACIFDPPWINQFFIWSCREVPRITRRRIVAITGNFWWEPKEEGWVLSKIFVVKKVAPVAKLVFVYDNVSVGWF